MNSRPDHPSIELRQRYATPGDPLVVARDRQAHSAGDGSSVEVMTASSRSAGPDSAASRVSTAVLDSLCGRHALSDTSAESPLRLQRRRADRALLSERRTRLSNLMARPSNTHDADPWSDAELKAFAADFDHHDPRFIENPSPVYEELRTRCPVSHSPRYGGFWVVTRYEEVRRAAKDWKTFTSSVPNVTAIPSSHPRGEPDIPIEVDPPLHTRYRQLVAAALQQGACRAHAAARRGCRRRAPRPAHR